MTPANPTQQVLAELAALREQLSKPTPVLLSKRQAAAMLGVSRGRTLEAWIADGTIRTVRSPSGRVKVPLAEVQRLGTQGAPPKVTKASQPVRKRVEVLDAKEARARLKALGF